MVLCLQENVSRPTRFSHERNEQLVEVVLDRAAWLWLCGHAPISDPCEASTARMPDTKSAQAAAFVASTERPGDVRR
jgi:hypothetical protein